MTRGKIPSTSGIYGRILLTNTDTAGVHCYSSTISQIVGNAARVCTNTSAIHTMPFFPVLRSITKERPEDEA